MGLAVPYADYEKTFPAYRVDVSLETQDSNIPGLPGRKLPLDFYPAQLICGGNACKGPGFPPPASMYFSQNLEKVTHSSESVCSWGSTEATVQDSVTFWRGGRAQNLQDQAASWSSEATPVRAKNLRKSKWKLWNPRSQKTLEIFFSTEISKLTISRCSSGWLIWSLCSASQRFLLVAEINSYWSLFSLGSWSFICVDSYIWSTSFVCQLTKLS